MTEGANLYYTQARANAAIATKLQDGTLTTSVLPERDRNGELHNRVECRSSHCGGGEIEIAITDETVRV